MEKKKSFILILLLVVSIHAYLFAQLRNERKVIAQKTTNNNIPIKLNNVVIKKQEVKPKQKKIEEVVVKKKTIIKKKLPKTKSKNIVKKTKKLKKKKVVKKIVKKSTPKKTFKKPQIEKKTSQKIKEKAEKINPKILKALENEYLLKLKRLIDKNKVYPNAAKRLKQMGKVYVSFTISKNGEIKNVKISKNSKYRKLNKAASEILYKIKRFEPIPIELNKSSWKITVPIVYQIIRS